VVVGINEKVSMAEGEACYVSQFVRRVSLDAKKEKVNISSCSNTAQGQDC
jgi:hypothetical protein